MKGGDFYAQETHALAGGGDGPVPTHGGCPAASAAQLPQDAPFLKKSFLIPSISKTKDVT